MRVPFNMARFLCTTGLVLCLNFSLGSHAQNAPDEELDGSSPTREPAVEENKEQRKVEKQNQKNDSSEATSGGDGSESKQVVTADDNDKKEVKVEFSSPPLLPEKEEPAEMDAAAFDGSKNSSPREGEIPDDLADKKGIRIERADREKQRVDKASQKKLDDNKTKAMKKCRELLKNEQFRRARGCYKRVKRMSLSDDEFDTVGALLSYSRKKQPEKKGLDFLAERFVLHGGGELVVTSTVLSAGIHVGLVSSAVSIGGGYLGPLYSALFPLSVLWGGAVGFGLSSASLFIPGLSEEDIALLRAGSVLGAILGIGSLMALNDLDRMSILSFHPSLQVLLSSSTALVPLALAIPLVWAFDVPTGAGASALSGLWMGAALGGLGILATGNPLFWGQPGLVFGLGGALGGTIMFGVGTLFDLERPHTWVMDVSAAIGASLAFALTLITNAPNPAVGYGVTAGGLVLGASTGLLFSKALGSAISQDALPGFNVLPLLLPDNGQLAGPSDGDVPRGKPVVGLQITGTL